MLQAPLSPRLLSAAIVALTAVLSLGACGEKAPPSNSQPEPAAAAHSETVASPEVGKRIYQQTCSACHDSGAAGAPRRGDKAAWAPRIATGQAALYKAALEGMNAMPPRGGSGASDAEIKAAVDYLVAESR